MRQVRNQIKKAAQIPANVVDMDPCLKQAQNVTSALTKVNPTDTIQAASPVVLEPTGTTTAEVVLKRRSARMGRLKTAPSAHPMRGTTTQSASHAKKVLTILEKPELAKVAHLVSTKICVDRPPARSARSQARSHFLAKPCAMTAMQTTTAPILPICTSVLSATSQ